MQPNIPNVNPNNPMNGQNNPYYNMNKSKSNIPSQPISINELSRFGHSVTALLPNVSILFGGAKGLSYKYDLCNDCFLFRTEENTWTKLSSVGDIPCPRAAHAAAAIDQTHLAIFGGAKMGGALAPDDLYVLQLSYEDKRSYWIKLENTGAKPGSRYGHTMCYYKPYLLIIGGNLGTVISNEVWICNIENSFSTNQISWSKLDCGKNLPCPRMYHASSLCKYGGANNMVIVFGGRGEKNNSLNDCWGLRKHRNGNWDWVSAPYTNTYTPQKRFQHTVNFFYNFLIVLGGRNESKDTLSFPIEIYDTENSEWTCVSGFNKFRHTSWLSEGALFTHGGFELSNTTVAKNDLIKIDINKMFNSSENLKKKYEKLIEEEKKKKLANSKKNTPNLSPVGGIPPLRQKVMNMTQMEKNQIRKELKQKEKAPMSSICIQKPQIQKYGECASSDYQDKLLIQQVQFDDKWNIQPPTEPKDKPLHDIFIEYLLRPSVWLNEENEEAKAKFHFGFDEIAQLTKQCLEIIANQPNILKVSTPVKVFGDIHGQFIDLMNFFDKWGCPSETMNGDIMMNDYLFLGDYVDRGNMSLETICLLMALKVKYPDQIHLLRGNHEDILINSGFGFQEECERRLNDDSESEDSLFRLINNFFEYLPLAAVIDDEILCVHGGIGANVRLLSDIDGIKRPFEVIHEAETRDQKLVMDILWSDPTDSDEELSIKPNIQRDSNGLGVICKFGPDIVKDFLESNHLSYIIRAHECVLDGFERFAGGLLITVFSATDYCRRHGNAGAMLVINQQKNIIPHLIYPPDGGNNNWIEDEEYYRQRPPTPPRVRYNKNNY